MRNPPAVVRRTRSTLLPNATSPAQIVMARDAQ